MDLGDNLGPQRRQGVVPDDDRAVAALLQMPVGELHNMSHLPRWHPDELAASVNPGMLRDLMHRFSTRFRVQNPHHFWVLPLQQPPPLHQPPHGQRAWLH